MKARGLQVVDYPHEAVGMPPKPYRIEKFPTGANKSTDSLVVVLVGGMLLRGLLLHEYNYLTCMIWWSH